MNKPICFGILFVVTALCLTVAPAVVADDGQSAVVWVWSGAVTTDSAVVKAKLRPGIGQAKLLVHPTTEPEAVIEVPNSGHSEADANGIVTFSIAGLQPDREYRYSVETKGGSGPPGRFHTFVDGPMSFRIGFASCATTGSNHRIFDTLRALNPHLFIHMGDLHYEDIKRNDPSLFLKAYDRVLTSPRQSAFYRSTSVSYVWDDHDFGPNDADGTSASKPAALATYQQCVPHYPLSKVDGTVQTIQQAFTIGRVRFLQTDSRAERDPQDEVDGPQKTMLGSDQRAWLMEELRAARDRYALVVWVNGVPWITKNKPGSGHGWEPYSHERTVIADAIKELGLANRLIMLSGDGHMVAIDDGTNSNYASDQDPNEAAFPVIHGAPLHRFPRVKGGPYSHGSYAPRRWFPLIQANQFGLMDVKDDGTTIQIEVTCRDSKGMIIKNLVLRLTCDKKGCAVIH